MSQDVAILGAGIVGFALSRLLEPAALDAWGWRVAFLLGAAVVPVGLFVRRRLPETLQMPDPAAREAGAARGSARFAAAALAALLGCSVYLYGIDYITTYAQDSLAMS